MAFCGACCATESVDVPVDDVVEETKLLPVLAGENIERSAPQFRKVALLFKQFDRKGTGMLSAEDVLAMFRELEIRVGPGEVASMMEQSDQNGDGFLDFSEFMDFLCQSRVEERWEEHVRQRFALESILLLFWRARTCIVQIETPLGSIFELPLPDPFGTLDLVELMEALEIDVDPIQQALKFRQLAAFAKKTTGNCLGLLDHVVKYREKVWKSTEGHRQFLGLQSSSSSLEPFKAAGAYNRIYLSIEGAINLANIHRKALYALHAVNHLFKRLKLCSVCIVTCLQKRRTMAKILETFTTTTDACQKLAYFEELSIYDRVANDLESLLQDVDLEEKQIAVSKLITELEKFKRFKNPWKELKNEYEKTRRLAEGYDDWSIKLWNVSKVVLYHICKQYGMEVPGGNEGKDLDASPSIPLLKGFREVPPAAIP